VTPSVPSVLAELAQLLTRNAAPGVPEAERASALGLSAMLLSIAADTWDAAAERLVKENRALAELLGDAAAEDDFRLSVLQAENVRLRGALIAAHAAAEAAGDATRQAAIWAELVASTERRLIAGSLV